MLNSHSETLEECLVEDIRTDESTIVAALALGVCSSKHREASGRMHNLTSLLVEVWLAFENRLKAEDVLGAKVALVKKKNSTTTHRSQHRTFAANGAAVNQLIRTNEVGLIGALGDVDANQLSFERSTHLLNHHGLAVTRKTSDVDRVEDSRTDNVLEIVVESERNIGAILFWHKRLSHILRTTRRKIYNLRNGSHGNSRDRLLLRGSRCRTTSTLGCNVESIASNLALPKNKIREMLNLVLLKERIEFLERDGFLVVVRVQLLKKTHLRVSGIIRLSHIIKLHHDNSSYKTIIAQKLLENNSNFSL